MDNWTNLHELNKKQTQPSSFEILSLISMIAAIILVIRYAINDIGFTEKSIIIVSLLTFITLFFSALLFLVCAIGYTWDSKQKHIFELLLLFFFIADIFIFLADVNEGKPEMKQFTMLMNTSMYILSAVYWLIFWYFQKGKYVARISDELVKIIFFAFFGIYSLLAIVNYFTGFAFYVDENGYIVVTSMKLVMLTVAWFIIYLAIILSSKCDRKTKFSFASYALAPLLSYAFLIPFGDSETYIDISTSLGMFLYLVSIYLLFFNIYIDLGRLYLQREIDLEESRNTAMMLKINPHFIANTMSSIIALCDPGAPQARDLAAKFSKYLRDNYAEMTEEAMIPFKKELEYIENYLEVEKIRFTGLKVEYDIKTEDFYLPTLTVQPLVENAVRHGISKTLNASGTVIIESHETKNSYIISIIDNGVGFSEAKLPREGHIGISNARTRLQMLCNGSLEIISEPGMGSTCKITIPKGAK